MKNDSADLLLSVSISLKQGLLETFGAPYIEFIEGIQLNGKWSRR